MVSFLIAMLFCTLAARGAASLTVAKVKAEEPGRGSLVQRFQGTGNLVLEEREFWSLPEEQKVERVLVKPGSDVKKGDKLIRLDLDYLEEQIKTQEREIEMKQLALEQQELSGKPEARLSAAAQAKMDLETAKDELARAKEEQKRMKEAEDKEEDGEGNAADTAAEEAEAAKKAYEQAKKAYNLAAQEEKNTQKNENVRSRISGLEQKSTKLEIEAMTEKLDKLKKIKKEKGIVTAKKDGMLSSVGVSEGMITTGTEQIVLECGGLKARGVLPEEALGSVEAGDEISIQVQGETRKTVLKIERLEQETSKQGEEGQGIMGTEGTEGDMQIFWYGEVEKDSRRPGIAFTYEYSKKSSGSYDSLIPLSALHEANQTAYVLIAQIRSGILGEGYEAVKVPVTVIGKDMDNAAVEASFPEGALVIGQSNKYVKEGDRVRLDE